MVFNYTGTFRNERREMMSYTGPLQGYNKKTLRILALIAKNPEAFLTGYSIGKALKLVSGAVYPTLYTLENDEMIEGAWDESSPPGKPRRRFYRCPTVWPIRHLEEFFPKLIEKTPTLES